VAKHLPSRWLVHMSEFLFSFLIWQLASFFPEVPDLTSEFYGRLAVAEAKTKLTIGCAHLLIFIFTLPICDKNLIK
jgi:hypothetical protein